MTAVLARGLNPVPRVIETLERCIEKDLTRSAQIAIMRSGELLASAAVGHTATGAAATPETAYIWTCGTKPLIAVVLGALVDQGAIEFTDPIGRFIPELPDLLGRITLSDLLTHRAGLDEAGLQAYFAPDETPECGAANAALDEIAQTERDPEVAAGRLAAYSVFSNWFLLSVVVERVHNASCIDVVAKRVAEPLDAWFRLWLPRDQVRALDRAPFKMEWRDTKAKIAKRPERPDGPARGEGSEILDGTAPFRYAPGSSGVGPIASLVAVLDAVMSDAERGTEILLSQPTARTLISPHRVGVPDKFAGNDLTWGLGFTADARAFTPRGSVRTFGHQGISCIAFADPCRNVSIGVAFDQQLEGPAGTLRHGAVVGALTAAAEAMD